MTAHVSLQEIRVPSLLKILKDSFRPLEDLLLPKQDFKHSPPFPSKWKINFILHFSKKIYHTAFFWLWTTTIILSPYGAFQG